MLTKILISCFILGNVFILVSTARILGVFPLPSISHQVVFRKVTQELVKRGHEVTAVTPDPAYPKNKTPENLNEIDLHNISYRLVEQILEGNPYILQYSDEKTNKEVVADFFKLHLSVPEVRDIYFNTKKKKYDLILLEGFSRGALALSYVYNAPVILISSLAITVDVYEVMGAPTHPILYPTIFYKRLYNLTFFEKIKIILRSCIKRLEDITLEKNDNLMLQEYYGPNVPLLKELYDNVALVFVNLHPIWADHQPVPTGVVYMGGIHQLETNDLPENLKTYLDSSSSGVIYLSFGTNVKPSTLNTDKVQVIVKVLSLLPYNVLWKWDEDELPKMSNNIMLAKWFPQADVLKHTKIKLFITQAGLQSTDEAITAGVPLVAIPIFGDQFYNAEKYVRHGIGKMILIDDLNEEIFRDAVETVINDTSYRQNINKLRELMQDQRETPLERSMWWIEHVLRHGGKHLRAPAANISLAEYFEIEILLCFLTTFILVVILLIIIIAAIYRKLSKFVTKEVPGKFKIN